MQTKRKKTMTTKQIEANRRNAQKSTGPKTPEGKLRSALNATTHGLTAKSLVFENDGNERLEDFIKLQAELQTDLQPVGRCEQGLVQRIAICHWRLNRAYRFEAAAVADERAIAAASSASLDEDDGHVPLHPASIFLPNTGDLERLIRYEGLIDRELNRTITQLDRRRTFRLKKEQSDEPEDDDDQDLNLTAALYQLANLQSQFPAKSSPTPSQISNLRSETPAAPREPVSPVPKAANRKSLVTEKPSGKSGLASSISQSAIRNSQSPSGLSQISNSQSETTPHSEFRIPQSPPAHIKSNPCEEPPRPPTPRKNWSPPTG